MQQAVLILICHSLITSHHTHSKPINSRASPCVHPFIHHSSPLTTLLPSSSHPVLTGKDVGKSNWATLCSLPALSPCPAFLTCRLPVHYSISSIGGEKKERKKKKERQTRPGSWDQGGIRTWLPPVPDEGNGDGDWVGQSMDDSCRFGTVGLGSLDGSFTEKERREEKKGKKSRASKWQDAIRQGHSRDQAVGPFPVSAHFPCLLHRISLQTGDRGPGLPALYMVFSFLPLSLSFDLLPFRAPEDGGSSRR